jgi:hypothetical protein
MTVAERLSYIPGFVDAYSTEVAAIERAGERLAERIEREQGKLTRGDGTPVYAPAEMAERQAAIVAEASAEFDQAVSRYLTQSEREVKDLEAKLARLEGEDGWEKLSESERQTAATRREFIKEDVATLPSPELIKRARAAIAAGDKAACWLWHRYLGQRLAPVSVDGTAVVRTGGRDLELVTVLRELGALFGDEDRARLRREIEAKIRAAEALPIAISGARSQGNGSDARSLEQYRRHLAARF